jgi:hypothetical protein
VFHKVDICIDPILSCGYLTVPKGGVAGDDIDCTNILYFDFSKSITSDSVRWSWWSFKNTNPAAIALEVNNTTRESIMRYAFNNVYGMDTALKNDAGTVIDTIATFAPVGTGESGAVNHFHGLRLRIKGAGYAQLQVFTLDEKRSVIPPSILLNSTEEGFRDRIFNLVTEKAKVKLSQVDIDSWMHVTEFTLLSKVIWEMHPNP